MLINLETSLQPDKEIEPTGIRDKMSGYRRSMPSRGWKLMEDWGEQYEKRKETAYERQEHTSGG
jgi:hypothetical protein